MSIAKSLRENAALVAGIVLPVVVVMLFLLSTWIPKLFVDPPQYDFLYVEDGSYYNNPSPWRHQVSLDSQNHLLVKAYATKPEAYAPTARVYLFEHESDSVREIMLPTPASTDGGEEGIVVEVTEFTNRYIDPSHTSPDGYSLVENNGGRRGLLGIFSSGNARGLAISKNGAVFEAVDRSGQYWYSARLIGWILPPPQ